MPEYLPGCVKKVEAKKSKLCDWDTVCKIIQENTDVYCKERLNQDGTPFDEPVPQIQNGVVCYCCCSCFASFTPIEVTPGEFVAIRDIDTEDLVLAGAQTAGGMTWAPSPVVLSNGIGPNLEFDFIYYVQYEIDGVGQQVLATIDHMFLMENGKVKPVQYLVPGDQIRRPGGGTASVAFVVVAKYVGGLHHIAFADFDNKTLDGHLVSANGIVAADYAVQLAYSAGQLNKELLDQPTGEPLQVGTPEYAAHHENEAMRSFLGDHQRWPRGLKPLRRSLVNVPAGALAFFTRKQAEQLRAAIGTHEVTSTINMATTRWLMNTIYGSYRPGVTFLLDWDNELPNVYGWKADGTTYVLVTGGLALLKGMQYQGLALLLAHGIAAATQELCVGPADYAAVFSILRMRWSNDLFFEVYMAGYAQLEALFDAITDRDADPKDLCAQPSLDCRLSTYQAAATMFPMPSCADPASFFAVTGARGRRRGDRVTVSFNLALDIATAESTDNYQVREVETGDPLPVRSATVVPGKPSAVRLIVDGALTGREYEVAASRVISETNLALNPKHASATFVPRS